MTYTEAQQKTHRKAFIEECRQKAWGLACHADWVSKGMDEVMVRYTKLQEEDTKLEAESKELANALDYHTVENRNKRKAIQERRHKLAEEVQLIAEDARKGQKALQQLLQGVESALELATHAERWEWKEVETAPEAKHDENSKD